jgi:hypothetical protein
VLLGTLHIKKKICTGKFETSAHSAIFRDFPFKSDIFEIFWNTVEDRKNFLKHIFFNMGYQRPSNGEYIAGEKDFFGHSWSPGEPSENRPIKHRENTFLSIKIDRVIRFCSTFFLKFGIDGGQQKMYTSDPSATYVSWNPGLKLETRIFVSRSGNPLLEN